MGPIAWQAKFLTPVHRW